MASLMPTLLDFDEFNYLSPVPADPTQRCGVFSTSSMLPPAGPPQPCSLPEQQQQSLVETTHIPFATPLDNPPRAIAPQFPSFATQTGDQPGTTVGFGNLTQHYIAQYYGITPILPRPQRSAATPPTAAYGPLSSNASLIPPLTSQPSPSRHHAGPSFLSPGVAPIMAPPSLQATPRREPGAASSASASATSSAAVHPVRKRRTPPASAISKDKLEERRRKNRESSSRCYYNRKKQIEQIERTLSEQKRRAIALYAQELELRNENARLKKDLVLRNIRIPAAMLNTTRTEPLSHAPGAHSQPR